MTGLPWRIIVFICCNTAVERGNKRNAGLGQQKVFLSEMGARDLVNEVNNCL